MKFQQCFTLVTVAVFLNGCMAVNAVTDLKENSYKKQYVPTGISDTIVAMGLPKTPIKGYENALALAGKQYAYLVQPNDNSNELKEIFNKADLTHITVRFDDDHLKVSTSQGCHSKYGCADIEIFFQPPTEIPGSEVQKMKSLGFACNDYPPQNIKAKWCWKDLKSVNFTITEPVTNQANLTHQFKQPVPIKFYQFDENQGAGTRTMANILAPLAIAFDIITSPIYIFFPSKAPVIQ